jgi:hypothetical protein
MDIALFVGFVRVADGVSLSTLPDDLVQWLTERGWKDGPYKRPLDQLQDVPVPIESWQRFDSLFNWRSRTADDRDGAAYLGAAVRSFFVQGGRKCYVVRVDDPWPLETLRADRLKRIAGLLPGYPAQFLPSPEDRFSWHGVGHLFGLPDVSFVAMPDLAEAVSMDRVRVELPPPPPGPTEVFVECTPAGPTPPLDRTIRDIGPPVANAQGFQDWAKALAFAANMISASAREVQLVAAVPIPETDLLFDSAPSTAFLQLAYPWVKTPASDALAGGVESPDGALTGILARNAVIRGTFRSAANLHLADIYDFYPSLDRKQHSALIDRVCLLGPTPGGLRLLSDVTMSGIETYRPGSVSRLIGTMVRTARRIGEDVTFQPSGERLWGEIASRLDSFLRGLYQAGVFRGATAGEAYEVHCGRGTMTQNDIDNGRVIASVQFDAAAPVDTITVVLIVNEGQPGSAIQSEAA